MDPLQQLDLDLLIEQSRARRARLAADEDHEETALALEPQRCSAMLGHLKGQKDSDGRDLGAVHVSATFEPDERGLLEVLFVARTGPRYVGGVEQPAKPMTAFMRGTELAYVVEGW